MKLRPGRMTHLLVMENNCVKYHPDPTWQSGVMTRTPILNICALSNWPWNYDLESNSWRTIGLWTTIVSNKGLMARTPTLAMCAKWTWPRDTGMTLVQGHEPGHWFWVYVHSWPWPWWYDLRGQGSHFFDQPEEHKLWVQVSSNSVLQLQRRSLKWLSQSEARAAIFVFKSARKI